ncbi:transcription factor bHLH112-like isoform X2 [Nymphaea colorata]|uniref:transcription factor bHLH112-like isoform X2 n=1 Tax=Nymphaea colorata TaxID=210225 RepID=UPI00129DFA28|nr:transcription factor bHLH112-like isoform X2 [Nymphaea colorata]
MDSANLDHHHQSHHVAPSLHLSSFLASASSHSWNPNLLLNHGYTENSVQAIQMFNPEFAGLNMSSVNVASEHDAMVQLPTVTHPELDQFNTWGTNSENYSQYVRIKEELEDSVSNFHGFQRSSGELYADHPPISLDYSGAAVTSGNSLWAQQNLPPANFGSQNFHATSGNYRPTEIGCLGRVDLNYLQQPINIPVSNNEKRSGVMNEATQGIKRNSSTPQTKTSEGSSKRPRLESSTSMPPLKVRKEKLGDRISALQQLVSPFGKTDTASVLKEAIGYIKFLHGQVETLSVPYLRSSSSSGSGARAIQGVPNKAYCSAGEKKEEDEVIRNLRSRGLCLVPLSCMSHLSNDHVGALWPHTNFGGP